MLSVIRRFAPWRIVARQIETRAEAWMTRRHPPRSGEQLIDRKRIYILPTRAGWVYALLAFIVLLAAMNYSNAMAYLLAFWLAAIGFVTMHETHANLMGLAVRLSAPDAVFAGETAFQPVQLRNSSRRAKMAIVADHDRHGLRAMATVDCHDEAHTLYGWNPPGRGVHAVPRIAISSNWPLGLFRSWSFVNSTMQQVVYPQPAPAGPRPPTGSGDAAEGQREQHSAEELAGLRDYQAGDSPRTIHWRSLAAHDQLASKRFAEPQSETHWLDLDRLPAHLDLEARLALLCRFILDLHGARQRYGLRLGTQRIPPDAGSGHRDRCLEALARYG